MSEPMPEVDEQLWQLYLSDCEHKGLTPSIKDYLIWLQEEDYDEAPLYDSD